MENEFKRKSIHIANGFWIFILPFFTRIIAGFIVFGAFIYVFILCRPNSRFGSFFEKSFEAMAREEDKEKGFLIGPTIYVIMVFLLILLVDYRIAGVLFSILAFGDGFATVIGIKFGKHKLVNNKSLEGSIAFFVSSVLASITIFYLISEFNTPEAGLSLLPSLILPANLGISMNMLFLIFILLCFILTLIELFLGNLINDNYLIPISGCFIVYTLLELTFSLQLHG